MEKSTKSKILGHISAISSFLVGSIFAHQAHNAYRWSEKAQDYVIEPYLRFFNIDIPRTVVFDIGLGLIGTGFFIEFCQSFKPLKCK